MKTLVWVEHENGAVKDVTLQAVTAVRDKVVAAYQEILRMPI